MGAGSVVGGRGIGDVRRLLRIRFWGLIVRWLFLLIFALPLLELWTLLWLADKTSGGTAFLVVIGMGAFGVWLIRRQGLAALQRVSSSEQIGQAMAQKMGDSVFIAMAAVLFIIPGLITDAVGLILLIPPMRHLLGSLLVRALGIQVHSSFTHYRSRGMADDSGDVIDSYVVRRNDGPNSTGDSGESEAPRQIEQRRPDEPSKQNYQE